MSMNVPCSSSGTPPTGNSAPSYNPDWCAIPSPQANFFSRTVARCSKPIYENFPLGPIEVKIPGITVREHCRLRGCRLRQHWSTEHHRFTKVSVILLAAAATLVACSVLAYVQFVRPIAVFDYRVEAC